MANMYKMAKAFGRAMNSRIGNGKAAKAINKSETASKANEPYSYKNHNEDAVRAYRQGQAEGTEDFYVGRERANERAAQNMDPTAKRIWENYDFDYERAYCPDGAYQRAVELSGVEDAPSTKEEFFDRFGFEVSERPEARHSDISRQISNVADENSTQRLGETLSDEISTASDDAANKYMRKNAKDIPMSDQFDSEMAGINREALAKEIEDAIFEALKRHGGERDATDIISDVTSKYK